MCVCVINYLNFKCFAEEELKGEESTVVFFGSKNAVSLSPINSVNLFCIFLLDNFTMNITLLPLVTVTLFYIV